MKKTLVCIVGNVCAGKSTLIAGVKDSFVGYEVLSIDEYRLRYNATTPTTEKTAVRMLMADVLKAPKVILECVGTGAWFGRLVDECKAVGSRVIIIQIDTLNSACILREKARTDAKHFCYDYEMTASVQYNFFELKKLRPDAVIDGNQPPDGVMADFLKVFGKD